MRVMRRGLSQLEEVGSTVFEGEHNALIKYSRDGYLFAYYL